MIALLIIPLVASALCMAAGARLAGRVNLAGSLALALACVPAAAGAVRMPSYALGGALYMDALSAYMASMVSFLGLASSCYSLAYIDHELKMGLTDEKGVRRYYFLLQVFIFTMLLVAVSNDLALMWIAVEATTIASAALIGLGYYKRPLAIEAAWKYLILCTVGITFALMGTFITFHASSSIGKGTLRWTELRAIAGAMNPATMKLAFVFLLVGYGTKAGLAPVHNWLPDAHSEAPSPISALLSGILLNMSFYGILRFVSIVEPSTGRAFTGGLLTVFGMLSLGVAAVFMLVQDNYKRLLAYSSIEHMGLISLGVGIGGPVGLYGSLLHVLNHAIAKPLMFFASGRIQARYMTTRIESVSGVLTKMPVLGAFTFVGALALAGAPPLNIFMSEFTVLWAGAGGGRWVLVTLSLVFLAVVFYAMVSSFGRMLLGEGGEAGGAEPSPGHAGGWLLSYGTMGAMAALIVALGFRVPGFVDHAIRECIKVMGGG